MNVRYRGAPLPLYISLIGVMAAVGLWHGAGWGFVLWGALHGVYLVLFRIWESLVEKRGGRIYAWETAFWRVATLSGVMLAWVPFRAATVGQAFTMMYKMVAGFSLRPSYSINLYLVTAAVFVYCVIEPWLARAMKPVEGNSGAPLPWGALALRTGLYACGILLFLIFDDQDIQFIYFQF